jgi:hypothetical protein
MLPLFNEQAIVKLWFYKRKDNNQYVFFRRWKTEKIKDRARLIGFIQEQIFQEKNKS